MLDKPNVIRYLEWFQKKRGYLSGKEAFSTLTIKELREIFGIQEPSEDPYVSYSEGYDPYMGGGYPVEDHHVPLLQPHFKQKINLKKHDYFVSVYDNTPLEERLKKEEARKWEEDDPKQSIEPLPHMKRVLRWFKNYDQQVGEEVTSDLDIQTLRDMYGYTNVPYLMTDEEFDMRYKPSGPCGCILKRIDLLEKLQPYFKHKINQNKYDYYLTGYQEKEPPHTE